MLSRISRLQHAILIRHTAEADLALTFDFSPAT